MLARQKEVLTAIARSGGRTNFLAGMIADQERRVAALRARLARLQALAPPPAARVRHISECDEVFDPRLLEALEKELAQRVAASREAYIVEQWEVDPSQPGGRADAGDPWNELLDNLLAALLRGWRLARPRGRGGWPAIQAAASLTVTGAGEGSG